jgi:hypothetical protein
MARELEMARWRAEMKEVTGASKSWMLSWQVHRRRVDTLRQCTATWLRAWGVAQSRWRTQTPVTAVRPRHRRKWSRDSAATVFRTHPRRDLFTAERNPPPGGTNHGDRRESERTINRRWSALHLISFSALYHHEAIQLVWQSLFRANFLQISCGD